MNSPWPRQTRPSRPQPVSCLSFLDTPLVPRNLSRLERREAYRTGHIRLEVMGREGAMPATASVSLIARLPSLVQENVE
jgi:hypothetical protein